MSSASGKADVVASFQNFDLNKDGLISLEELRTLFLITGDWTEDRVNSLFCLLDVNSDGFLEYGEFINWAFHPILKEGTSAKLEVKKDVEDNESKTVEKRDEEKDKEDESEADAVALEEKVHELEEENMHLKEDLDDREIRAEGLKLKLHESEERLEILENCEERWREKNSMLRMENEALRLRIDRLGARVGDLEADMVQKLMAHKVIITVKFMELAGRREVVATSLGGHEYTFDVSPGSMLVQTLQLELAARMSVDRCFITLVTEMGDPIQDLTKDVPQAIKESLDLDEKKRFVRR